MSGNRLLQCLFAAIVTICFLTLPAVPSADAGRLKSHSFHSSHKHVHAGHGFKRAHKRHFRHKLFKSKRFYKHRKQFRFAKRHKHKRRHLFVPSYYYGYRRGYRYRDYPVYEPDDRSERDTAVAPVQSKPVVPKWVHVAGVDGGITSSTADTAFGDIGSRRNCLSIVTEIAIDGKPTKAFGEACITADGTWQLVPSNQIE